MSWPYEKLGNLITESRIPAINPDPNRRIRVKLNVLGVEKRPFENEVAGATKQFQRKAGQFIYGKQNFHKGAFGIIPDELNGFETSADIPSFDVREDCLPEWIFYYFKIGNRYLEMVKYARGVGSKRIHPEQIADVEIPLPNKKEQKRLIKAFTQIEDSSQNITSEFINQEDLLTQLRQSFLREAMQGKLVKQDPKDGHAKDLLEKIKTEKAKSGRKEKELPPIKPEEIPFEIPENWVWCRLGEIANNIEYGTSEKADLNSSNIPVLRMNNIQDGKLEYENLKYVSPTIDDLPKLYLKKNDLLFNRTNSWELVGKAGVYHGTDDTMTFASYLIRVQFQKGIFADFVNAYINSSLCRITQLEPEIIQQNGQANFNGTKLRNIICPLPPSSEQSRIIKRFDELMNICDGLQQSIQASREQNELLLQQVLKEALTG